MYALNGKANCVPVCMYVLLYWFLNFLLLQYIHTHMRIHECIDIFSSPIHGMNCNLRILFACKCVSIDKSNVMSFAASSSFLVQLCGKSIN